MKNLSTEAHRIVQNIELDILAFKELGPQDYEVDKIILDSVSELYLESLMDSTLPIYERKGEKDKIVRSILGYPVVINSFIQRPCVTYKRKS